MSETLLERSIEAARARERSTSPNERRARGIVHTPAELARWALVRAAELAKAELGLPSLLCDASVILDPALGTGVWLAAALERAAGAAMGGMLLGFDVDADALSATRAQLEARARALQTTLVMHAQNTLGIADPWPEEARDRVRVIVGNPPWAARSASRGTSLSDAWLKDFHVDAEGALLRERRVGVLSDDYVRFFRWAIEQVRSAPRGALLCFATNSSFLDGPVHRGMRARLLETFDYLEVLDLGGNALVPQGEARDENLFGVRVGACVTLGVRREMRLQPCASRLGRIAYQRLKGSRADKLAALAQAELAEGQSVTPSAPLLCFVPRVTSALSRARSFSLSEAFVFHREGVQTNRDALVTAPDADELLARLFDIAEGRIALTSTSHFDAARARAKLSQALAVSPTSVIQRLAYRPFDERYFCNLSPLCHRPRPDLLAAMACSSLSLLSVRKERGERAFNLFAVSRSVADACFLSTRSSCRTRQFPSHGPDGQTNLSPQVAERLSQIAGIEVCAERCIAYVVGCLLSPSLRADLAAFRDDSPRVPWPRDPESFATIAGAGQLFTDALLRPAALASDDCAATSIIFDVAQRRLWVGDVCIEGVSTALWEFEIGHFRVLRDRCVGGQATCPGELVDRIERTRLCVLARDTAERAYQTVRSV